LGNAWQKAALLAGLKEDHAQPVKICLDALGIAMSFEKGNGVHQILRGKLKPLSADSSVGKTGVQCLFVLLLSRNTEAKRGFRHFAL